MKRFLDSIGVGDEHRAPVRTLRAMTMTVAHGYLIMLGGSGVMFAWKLPGMISRLANNEALGYPFSPVHGGKVEQILTPDWSWNIDQSNWFKPGNSDAIPVALQGFDIDPVDPSLIYIAAGSYNGWGILQNRRVIYPPDKEQAYKQEQATDICVVVTSGGRKVLLQTKGNIYDVTNPRSPVQLSGRIMLTYYAKSADGRRVALTTRIPGKLEIYDADALLTGRGPLYTSSGAGYKSITSDGTNFYAMNSGGELEIIRAVGANGYALAVMLPPDPTLSSGDNITINCHDGHLVISGTDTSARYVWRVYRISDLTTLTPLSLDLSDSVVERMNALDGIVISGQLLIGGRVVGDVYDLPGTVIPPPVDPPKPIDPPKPPVDTKPPVDLTYVKQFTPVFQGQEFYQGQEAQAKALYDYAATVAKGDYNMHRRADGSILVWWW